MATIKDRVVEIHGLVGLNRAEYREQFCAMLRKLNKFHTLFHVHANNLPGEDCAAFDRLYDEKAVA